MLLNEVEDNFLQYPRATKLNFWRSNGYVYSLVGHILIIRFLSIDGFVAFARILEDHMNDNNLCSDRVFVCTVSFSIAR